jgi:hypothetical protein
MYYYREYDESNCYGCYESAGNSQRKERKIKRSKYPLPPQLKELSFNHARGLYEIEESGIIYAFPFSLKVSLRLYYRDQGISGHTIANWYQNLEGDERGKVVLSKPILMHFPSSKIES